MKYILYKIKIQHIPIYRIIPCYCIIWHYNQFCRSTVNERFACSFPLFFFYKSASFTNQFPFSEEIIALRCSRGEPWKFISPDTLNMYTSQNLLPSELKPHNCNSERKITQADLLAIVTRFITFMKAFGP